MESKGGGIFFSLVQSVFRCVCTCVLNLEGTEGFTPMPGERERWKLKHGCSLVLSLGHTKRPNDDTFDEGRERPPQTECVTHLGSEECCWSMVFMALSWRKCWLMSVCRTISMQSARNCRNSLRDMLVKMLQSFFWIVLWKEDRGRVNEGGKSLQIWYPRLRSILTRLQELDDRSG